jgi:ATP-dependent RNA helicase DeaD
MTDPVEVVAGTRNAGAENVKHLLYTVHAKDKYYALKRLADFYPMIYGIIFCRTRRETQEIADKLIQDGYNADSLHGDLSQVQRDYVMQKFRVRNIRLLVATDVAARGLDVDDLTHVIHYSLPDEKQVYTHRSGRTGRIGKAGISIAITHLREKYAIGQIEKLLGIKFTRSTIPTGREICEKQLFNMIDKMENVEIDHSQIDTYLPVIYKKLEWLDKEELIKRFVSLEFNRFLNYYRDADVLNEPKEDHERGGKRSRQRDFDGRSEKGYTRIFINLGKMDGLVPNGLIEMINKNVEGPKIPIGRIDLMKKFSFFEVKSEHAKKLIKTLNRDTYFRGSRVSVELAQGKDAQEKKAFTKRVDSVRKKRKKRFN